MSGGERADPGGGTRLRVGGWLPNAPAPATLTAPATPAAPDVPAPDAPGPATPAAPDAPGPATPAPPDAPIPAAQPSPPVAPGTVDEQAPQADPGPATAELPPVAAPVPDHVVRPTVGVDPPAGTGVPAAPDEVTAAATGTQPPRRRARAVLLPVGALVAVAVVGTGVWLGVAGDGDVSTSFSTHPSGTAGSSAPTDAQLQAAPRTPDPASSPARAPAPSASVSSGTSPSATRSEQPRTLGDPYAGYKNPSSVAGMRLLGPPDYSGYCSSRDAGSAAVSGGAWRCTGSGQTAAFTIQPTDACRWTYRSRQVVAAAYNSADPYSWRCYSRH